MSLGALIGLGMSGTTFTVVLGAVGRMVPAEKRSLAFAIVSAGGSIGMFSFVPASQLFIGLYGWAMALLILAACALLVPLFSLYFKGVPGEVTAGRDEKEVSLSASPETGRHAFRLLVAEHGVSGLWFPCDVYCHSSARIPQGSVHDADHRYGCPRAHRVF